MGVRDVTPFNAIVPLLEHLTRRLRIEVSPDDPRYRRRFCTTQERQHRLFCISEDYPVELGLAEAVLEVHRCLMIPSDQLHVRILLVKQIDNGESRSEGVVEDGEADPFIACQIKICRHRSYECLCENFSAIAPYVLTRRRHSKI